MCAYFQDIYISTTIIITKKSVTDWPNQPTSSLPTPTRQPIGRVRPICSTRMSMDSQCPPRSSLHCGFCRDGLRGNLNDEGRGGIFWYNLDENSDVRLTRGKSIYQGPDSFWAHFDRCWSAAVALWSCVRRLRRCDRRLLTMIRLATAKICCLVNNL